MNSWSNTAQDFKLTVSVNELATLSVGRAYKKEVSVMSEPKSWFPTTRRLSRGCTSSGSIHFRFKQNAESTFQGVDKPQPFHRI